MSRYIERIRTALGLKRNARTYYERLDKIVRDGIHWQCGTCGRQLSETLSKETKVVFRCLECSYSIEIRLNEHVEHYRLAPITGVPI
jgi:DNA-directed RNA polymerase subunit RPC12/RpoP